MAKQEYPEEIIQSVLARISEIGVRGAVAEAGVPRQTVTAWKKAAEKAQDPDTTPLEKTEEKKALQDTAHPCQSGLSINGSGHRQTDRSSSGKI